MWTKIKGLLEKANKKLQEINEWCIENCFLAMAILAVFAFAVVYSLLWNWTSSQSKVVMNKGVDRTVVEKVVNQGAGTVYKEIQHVQKVEEAEQVANDCRVHDNKYTKELDKKYERVYLTPEESTPENINKELDKRGPDAVVVDTESNVKPGTTIYAIKNVKTTVGIGVYAGYNEGIGKSYGLHYRNRRTVVQLGRDGDGHLEGRVAYEVLQW